MSDAADAIAKLTEARRLISEVMRDPERSKLRFMLQLHITALKAAQTDRRCVRCDARFRDSVDTLIRTLARSGGCVPRYCPACRVERKFEREAQTPTAETP